MRYLSLCSGIEAATVAWSPLGWKAVAFAEIDAFPSAVLAYHFPEVPNLGDITKINGNDFKGKVDVLVGGTPCQSFSVAGLRLGLEDIRGNLTLEFVRIADESEPTFTIWENVPGVLSDAGNAFGCFIAALAGNDFDAEPGQRPPMGKNNKFWRWDRKRKHHVPKWPAAGWVTGPYRTIAWRTLDAQYFGLPQRRKRVFLVACPRNGVNPRKILFEFDGVRRDSPPVRKARKEIAGTITSSTSRSRGAGIDPAAIVATSHWSGGAHPPLSQSNSTGGIGMSDQELFSQQGAGLTLHAHVPEIVAQAMSCKWSKGTSGPAGDEHHNLTSSCYGIPGNWIGRSEENGNSTSAINELSPCLTKTDIHAVFNGLTRVRRITPLECERLQGFPDGYTAVPYRGKTAEQCPDGLRYKALGNSMAVPVMRWIGKRVDSHA